MPSQNAHTYLELPPSASVDPAFQQTLNDSLRQIARQFDSLTTGTGIKTNAGGSSGGGSVTITGAQLDLSVPGTLAIDDDVPPLISLPADATPTAIIALVKQASQGGPIQAQINVNGTKYAVVTIAVNQTSGSVPGSTFAKIPANQIITLDIIAAPQSFPGADLTVMIRF
jgi:hypothetical protein